LEEPFSAPSVTVRSAPQVRSSPGNLWDKHSRVGARRPHAPWAFRRTAYLAMRR